jgi:hypothetical protein
MKPLVPIDGGASYAFELAVERLFPRPPWPVVAGHVVRRAALGAVVVVIGLATAVYYAADAFEDFGQLQRERKLWSEVNAGDGAEISEVPATVRMTEHNAKWVLFTNELQVSFVVAGVMETRLLEFRTLFAPLGGFEPARVRFDPKRPERWALNWAVHAHPARLEALLFLGFSGGGLVGGALAFLGWALWLGADRVRRVALRGITVAGVVSEVVEQKAYGRGTGAFIYRFRMPASHGGRQREAVFSGKFPRPLLLLGGRQLVVCILAKDPNVFVVPREDSFPFDFSEEAQSGIRERMRAIVG